LYADTRKIANKFIAIYSDSRVFPIDWKFMIPSFIVQGPYPAIINAKNFADGINHAIELYDIHIPPDKLAYESMRYDDWQIS